MALEVQRRHPVILLFFLHHHLHLLRSGRGLPVPRHDEQRQQRERAPVRALVRLGQDEVEDVRERPQPAGSHAHQNAGHAGAGAHLARERHHAGARVPVRVGHERALHEVARGLLGHVGGRLAQRERRLRDARLGGALHERDAAPEGEEKHERRREQRVAVHAGDVAQQQQRRERLGRRDAHAWRRGRPRRLASARGAGPRREAGGAAARRERGAAAHAGRERGCERKHSLTERCCWRRRRRLLSGVRGGAAAAEQRMRSALVLCDADLSHRGAVPRQTRGCAADRAEWAKRAPLQATDQS
ncbi:polyketide synthase [Gracilaria domingensis]|nr:polyketide synthase [Gracilaria domingensis]